MFCLGSFFLVFLCQLLLVDLHHMLEDFFLGLGRGSCSKLIRSHGRCLASGLNNAVGTNFDISNVRGSFLGMLHGFHRLGKSGHHRRDVDVSSGRRRRRRLVAQNFLFARITAVLALESINVLHIPLNLGFYVRKSSRLRPNRTLLGQTTMS